MNTNSYFTIEVLVSGTVIIQLVNGDGTEATGTFYYWINSVPNAARDNYDGSIVPSNTAQYIKVNGSNPSVGTIIRLYRPETTTCCFGDGGDNGSYIRIHGTAETKISGNMASLIGFSETIPAACFRYMFYSGSIVDASELELPWTTLSQWCFCRLFYNCTKLIEPPYLPATTLADSCYRLMFRNCTALKKICRMACKNLAFASHYGMYQLCTALEKVTLPKFDTYANQALGFMFNSCSSLKELTVECPETLDTQNMFYCLAGSCMNLERLTCLAKNSTANCTGSWLGNDASYAAEHATFIKHPDATFWTEGTSGIPSGWTVKNMNPQVQSLNFNDAIGVYVKGNQKIVKIYGQNNTVIWEETS